MGGTRGGRTLPNDSHLNVRATFFVVAVAPFVRDTASRRARRTANLGIDDGIGGSAAVALLVAIVDYITVVVQPSVIVSSVDSWDQQIHLSIRKQQLTRSELEESLQ